MRPPIADSGLICPLHRKDVSKVCHLCPWYVKLRGRNPQSGQEIENWGCAIAFGPISSLEAAHQSRSTAAAVESLRNEVAKSASKDRSQELTACLAVMGARLPALSAEPADPKLITG